jgi:hypothetical protein
MLTKGHLHRAIGAGALVAALALPTAARADTNDSAMHMEHPTIHGVITSVHGTGLSVRDDRAGDQSITLHRGTVINPTGLQLRAGMQVTIAGHAMGRSFDADEIDAPADDVENQKTDLAPPAPPASPHGTFQTNGPSAEGGG